MSTQFDNEKLSHWLLVALLIWLVVFLVFGVIVFHLWLKAPTGILAAFAGTCCALHFAVTPWLFYASATPQNPKGHIGHRSAAIVLLFSAIAIFFFIYLRIAWRDDGAAVQFTNIGIILTILVGGAGLVVAWYLSRRYSAAKKHVERF